jgi:hypothetical protein
MGRLDSKKRAHAPTNDPMHSALARFQRNDTTSFADAWLGMEPTFSNKKVLQLWNRRAAEEGGETRFLHDRGLHAKLDHVARDIAKRYRKRRKKHSEACMFATVEVEADLDPWGVERQEIRFGWEAQGLPSFDVRLGIDPETFEYSIKPVPVAWLYDERFVAFLDEFIWGVPERHGLRPSMQHGGGQFSFSAKTYLQGSLLADDIAHRLDHPELSTWVLDYPNCDDRAFRASKRRAAAFQQVLDEYWRGAYHPRALGTPTVESAYFDRGFEPAHAPRPDLIDPRRGPVGDGIEVFQNNFVFGRAVRLRAQSVEPGYWQTSHPDEDGYRPDQIMRYGEGNLNRLQIAGEWHVKSGKVLDDEDVRELDAPLDPSMLYDEASWEHRAQMSKSSARDFVDAVLLEVHHALWLVDHPHVTVRASLAQDQLLGDAEATLARYAPETLAKLRRAARKENLAVSRGKVKSDRIEPETMLWAAWRHLPGGERAAIAREVVLGFVERVENAASKDPRPSSGQDPMEPHRHRIHPQLWRALEDEPGALDVDTVVRTEHAAWQRREKEYLARRPIWSPLGAPPPWKGSRKANRR